VSLTSLGSFPVFQYLVHHTFRGSTQRRHTDMDYFRYIAKDQLGATDDCGFSPFSIDVKPKHGSPDFAREVAMQKIKARIEGARMASEKLGI